MLFGKTAAAIALAYDVRVRFDRSTPKWVVADNAHQTAATIRELFGDASYWPTPWLGGVLSGHLQTIWYGLNPRFNLPAYAHTDEQWVASDGGTIGLAWPEAPDKALLATAPIVLILPGLCGSIKGVGHVLHECFAAGLRPVCWHARGCGQPLTSPRFNIFGSTDDLRTAIARIQAKWPDALICLYSISAGTALMVRYLGEEGSDAPIAAAVANAPGYDIGVCLSRVSYLYDSGFYIGVLKKHWLEGPNGDVLRRARPEVCELMANAPDMHSFMVAASPFALWEARGNEGSGSGSVGVGSETGGAGAGAAVANAFAAFLAKTNPMGVAERIRVPGLIINADDDPVCAARNTEESGESLLATGATGRSGCPTIVLLRYPRGGHCCFAEGWTARRFGDRLAAGVLAALARK